MINPTSLHSSLSFKAVRSSGKGGQHVNKVSTAVELYFDVKGNAALNEEQKKLILEKLKNRISDEGILMVVSQTERSQLANKKKAIERFDALIIQALKKKAKRIPTKISEKQKQKRLESKKLHSEKKKQRKVKFDD